MCWCASCKAKKKSYTRISRRRKKILIKRQDWPWWRPLYWSKAEWVEMS